MFWNLAQGFFIEGFLNTSGSVEMALSFVRKCMARLLLAGILLASLTACSTPVPSKPRDLCAVFTENRDWFDDAREVYAERKVPINIVMSFIYHESGYRHDAKPPMRWFLFIPYGRGSSAYGYPQAQDEVWEDYQDDAGGFWSSRSNFKDSLDFISWYILKTRDKNGVAVNDVYNQYLNYHEGWQGYKKGSWKKNSSLKKLAEKVSGTARKYGQQLKNCDL